MPTGSITSTARQEVARWEVEMHDTGPRPLRAIRQQNGRAGPLVGEADRAAARLESVLAAVEPAVPAEPRSAAQVSAQRCRSPVLPSLRQALWIRTILQPVRLAGDRQRGDR